jgi:hypothetical protein
VQPLERLLPVSAGEDVGEFLDLLVAELERLRTLT